MPAAIGIKRVAIAIASLLGAGLALLLALSVVISPDSVRDAVKAQIREVTGLDPLLRGEVEVSLFPTGSVRLNDVSLGDNRTGAAALSAQQVLVRLRFFPFLIGRIEIADVTLLRPTIMIAFGADGGSNWAGHIERLAQALTPSPDRAKSFSEIRISGGTVIVRDDGYRLVETLTNVEFALAWPSIARTFAATGQFTWNDRSFDATLSLSDFLAALTGERTGLKLRMAGPPFKIAFDGSMNHRPSLKIEGVLAADASSLQETLPWIATPDGSAFQRFALKAQMNVTGRSVAMTGVHIELDGNSGEGVLTYVADERPRLQGTLAVERLNLAPYVSTVRILTADRNWSRTPIELEGLFGMDLDFRISAALVTFAGMNFGQTAFAANVRAGNLTLAVGECQAFGGILRGSLNLSRAGAGAELTAQIQLTDVMLDQTLAVLFDVRRIEGRGNIDIALSGGGNNIYSLAERLNGTITLGSRKGQITGLNIEQSLRRLERNPLAVRGSEIRSGKTPYNELTVELKISDGIAHAKRVQLDAPSLRVDVGGTTSIAARAFDLKGTASLIVNGAADSFELPFVVVGSWDDPLFWPDIQLLIQRSGAAAPLLDAVRNRLKREQPPPALAGESPATPATAAPAR